MAAAVAAFACREGGEGQEGAEEGDGEAVRRTVVVVFVVVVVVDRRRRQQRRGRRCAEVDNVAWPLSGEAGHPPAPGPAK